MPSLTGDSDKQLMSIARTHVGETTMFVVAFAWVTKQNSASKLENRLRRIRWPKYWDD